MVRHFLLRLIAAPRLRALLAELLVVFIGVFAAFLLSDYQQQQSKTALQIDNIKAIRADIVAYIDNGSDPQRGFVQFFRTIRTDLTQQIATGQIKRLPGIIYGDYWYIEALNSMISSGRLNEIELQLYRDLAQFNKLHQNFMNIIQGFNQYQLQWLFPVLTEQPQKFFLADGTLSPAYQPLHAYADNLLNFSEISVRHAAKMVGIIDQHYPQLALPASEGQQRLLQQQQKSSQLEAQLTTP